MKQFKIHAAIALLMLCAPSYGIEIIKDKLIIGEVREGEVAAVSCKIKNNSSKPIEVGIRPSCDCIIVEPSRLKIEPGALQEVTVKVIQKVTAGNLKKRYTYNRTIRKNPI